MGKIHRLSDPPSIYKATKTLIVKGEVTKVSIWKDTLGNEYKKKGDKFIPSRFVDNHHQNNFIHFHLPTTLDADKAFASHSSTDWIPEKDPVTETFAVFCFVSFLLMAFFSGLAIGSARTKRSVDEKHVPSNPVVQRESCISSRK